MSDELIMTKAGMIKFKDAMEKHLAEVSKHAVALQEFAQAMKPVLADDKMTEIIGDICKNCEELKVTSANYKALTEFCDHQIRVLGQYEEM